MRLLRSWPLLVAALALTASVASAGTGDIVTQADGTCYNIATHQKVDCSTGAVVSTEANPFYDLTSEKLIITNAALALGSGDSCVAFDNHRNTLGMLAIKWVPTWAAQSVSDLAVQVRYHFQGATDTSSVFPLMPSDMPVASDTTYTKTFGRFGQYFNGSSVLPYPSEIVVHFAKANITGAYAFPQANMATIALPNLYGLAVCPTYISVRVRNINGPTGALNVYYTSGP